MHRAAVLFLAIVCTALSAHASSQHEVAIHVIAHEDDWQLFEGPTAYSDVDRRGSKVVFIYVTAGDAGNGATPAENPYYLARESGARAAVRFLANVRHSLADGEFATPTVRGHPITRYEYGNTVSWFLRLPDGHGWGLGFAGTGNVSLQKLRKREITELPAIDGSTTYAGWSDLVLTLQAIVEHEAADAWPVRLRIPDTDPASNPKDHSDHIEVGMAMEAAGMHILSAEVVHFAGHGTRRMPANLSIAESGNQAAAYAVTLAAIESAGCAQCGSTWAHHSGWVGRSYLRTTHGTSRRVDAHCVGGRCACTPRVCPASRTWDDLSCPCTP